MSQSPYITVMQDAARKAGECLLRHFSQLKDLPISVKGPGDFVSKADHESEKVIYDILRAAYPEFGFLMEESGKVEGAQTDTRWIIDPLDGTTNFLHGIPYWVIAIALEQNSEIIASVLYNPFTHEMYHAEKGKGAYLNGERISVSNQDALSHAVVVGSGPTMKRSENYEGEYLLQLGTLLKTVAGFRCNGSASLDLAYVAAGRLEGSWCNDLKPWDIAPGALLIQEAGGSVLTVKDNAGNPVYAMDIVAGNTSIAKQTKDLLRQVSDSNKPT